MRNEKLFCSLFAEGRVAETGFPCLSLGCSVVKTAISRWCLFQKYSTMHLLFLFKLFLKDFQARFPWGPLHFPRHHTSLTL